MKTPAEVVAKYGRGLGLGYHAYLAIKNKDNSVPLFIRTLRQLGVTGTADRMEERWILYWMEGSR